MSNTQKVILFFLGVGILVFCVLIIGAVSQFWNQPLGPALELATNTYVPAATFPPTYTPISKELIMPGHPSTGTPEPATVTPANALCGGPPVMTLLAIGSDQRIDSYLYGLGDVIRLVRVDFVTPRVTMMSFPRDLYVEIPGISDHYGITHGKINQSYLYGNPGFGYYDGADLGPGLMARTLAYNFGAHPDHYIAVNMRTFVNIVDAVDGITVTLPETIDGRADDQPDRKDLVFYAGTHYLTGKQALQLARLRPNGSLERSNAQNDIMCGLYDKLLSPKVVGDIPQLIKAFEDNIQTDLSPAEISQLSCLLTQLDGSNISFLHFPDNFFTLSRVDDPTIGYTSILDADFNLIRDYVTAFSQGNWLGTDIQVPTENQASSARSFCE